MRKALIVLGVALLAAGACGKKTATTTTAAGAGGSGAASTDFVVEQGKGDAALDIKGIKFTTSEVRIKVGQTVAWTNQDDFGHTSTGDNKEWNSQTISAKTMFVLRINKAGTYTYHCEIHKQMKATVVVE